MCFCYADNIFVYAELIGWFETSPKKNLKK